MHKKIVDNRWYKPQTHSGWHKDMPEAKRRSLVLKAHSNDYLAAARAMLALSNVSQDSETQRVARLDADYFFHMHHVKK